MKLTEIEADVLFSLIPGLTTNCTGFLFRAEKARWTRDEVIELLKDTLSVTSVRVYKFTRLLVPGEKLFEAYATRFGKNPNEDGQLFGKWPLLEGRVETRWKQVTSSGSYAQGFIDLASSEIAENATELASLFNANEFAKTGLMGFGFPHSPPISTDAASRVNEFLQLAASCRGKSYRNQAEWDEDLGPKERGLSAVISTWIGGGMAVGIPMLDANVEVALLFLFPENLKRIFLKATAELEHASANLLRDWEFGILR